MNKFLEIDTQILLAVNGWHSAWADQLMWIVSNKFTWIPLYLVLFGAIIYRYRSPIHKVPAFVWILLAFVLVILLSDMISTRVFKYTVCRLRPTHDPLLMEHVHIVNNYRGGLYSFVSSHAANTVGIAILFSLIWRKNSERKIVPLGLFFWVLLVCYSRMYLGVHYLSDLVCGGLLGALVAWLVFVSLRRWVLQHYPYDE